jgi:hypothetical protein
MIPMWEPTSFTRRDFLAKAGNGFGLVALADLLADPSRGGTNEPDRAVSPYIVRTPHHAPTAKRCIFLYLPGGPSHVDLFDPKPKLAAMDGQPLPFDKPRLERTRTGFCWPRRGGSRNTASAEPR